MILKRFFALCCLFTMLSCNTDTGEPDFENNQAEQTDSNTNQGEGNGEVDDQPDDDIEDESIFFSRISYVNTTNKFYARLELMFEGNKVIREEVFNSIDVLQNYNTYQYNEKGLLEKRIYYSADGIVDIINSYSYDSDDNLVLVETIRKNSTLDTLYTVYTYSDNLIEQETTDKDGNRLMYSQHYLNSEGFIYKTDNGIIAEIALQDGLPISKSVQYPDKTIQFEHVYLDSPLPKGPLKNFWRNFYGKMNNQIIRSGAGVISHEDAVDLPKYIVSAGDQLQQEFEFNSDGLPVKIVKTFDLIKSVWEIEYQN
ncbi:hypothetical protein [Flagellimonas sp. 2504JD4-2]